MDQSRNTQPRKRQRANRGILASSYWRESVPGMGHAQASARIGVGVGVGVTLTVKCCNRRSFRGYRGVSG